MVENRRRRLMKKRRAYFGLVFLVIAPSALALQQSAASQQKNQPTYHVTMIPGTITAINYQNRKSTEIGFQGSPLLPLAKGQGKVISERGRIAINAEFRNLEPAQKFGAEFLTYVIWAITPEGKANNLGELLLDGDKAKLSVTTSLQTFGLIVTAEPYYAVSEPSDAVVLENVVVPGTSGTIQQMNATYQLLGRGQYSYDVAAAIQSYPKSKVPLELEEARNAVQIARTAGAQQYASDALFKAQLSLDNAEVTLRRKGDKKQVVQSARDAVQNAADARRIAIKRVEDEQVAQEKAAEAQRTAQAQAEAATATAKQQQEEAARQQADLQKQQAELHAQQEAQARGRAELQAQQESQARAQADAATQEAMQKARQDQQAAAQAQQAAAKAEQEKEQLRAALLQQFNRILPTTDTPGGLKVNISDVLFDTAKYDLRAPAREALAKLSGIIIAHPGLKLQVQGYTDNVGGDTFNQTLSENRANSVRAYLINQGIDPTSVVALGYGKSSPVASNDSAAGRQQNRRVEIIISGEIIGTQIGHTNPTPQQ
jgi:outer membrane protein OmpA-like peptidoglycan-associated protein